MKLARIAAVAKLIVAFTYSVTIGRAQTLRSSDTSNRSNNDSSRRRITVEDQYIVVFKDQQPAGTDAAADPDIGPIKEQVESSVAELGGTVLQSYAFALNGFAAKLPPEALNALKENPNIAYIEEDSTVSISTTQTEDLSWGLDRIDQQSGTDGQYVYSATGTGVHAYIIDTGISSTHAEFTGRLGEGHNAVSAYAWFPQPWDDCQGHGTHVSSTVGGTTYGVAKSVTLHAVRVLDCFGYGTDSDVIAGMDWVTAQHSKNKGQKSVANMSLGGDRTDSLNLAATNMVAAGIVVAVAAGNDSGDACLKSPASAEGVITVGATDNTDSRAYFSNYGECVEIFAPGEDILGADFYCTTCSMELSGTSMASPHVAGVAALYLEKLGGTPAQITTAMLKQAVNDIVTDALTDPNEFLQSTGPAAGNKKCRAAGDSCRRFLCSSFKACCCSGLKCKGRKCR